MLHHGGLQGSDLICDPLASISRRNVREKGAKRDETIWHFGIKVLPRQVLGTLDILGQGHLVQSGVKVLMHESYMHC